MAPGHQRGTRHRDPWRRTDVTAARGTAQAILIDIGGVLAADHLPVAAAEWSARLGISPRSFLGALFGGNDDQVLIGRMSESAWWEIIRDRLRIEPGLLAEIRQDLASRQTWDDALVACLRGLRGRVRTGVVSNAWPGVRTKLAKAGLLDAVDEVVLSCEVGYAKPDARIYAVALDRIQADPRGVLFIDDTAANVAAAEALGMTGHLHRSTAETITRVERFLGRSA